MDSCQLWTVFILKHSQLSLFDLQRRKEDDGDMRWLSDFRQMTEHKRWERNIQYTGSGRVWQLNSGSTWLVFLSRNKTGCVWKSALLWAKQNMRIIFLPTFWSWIPNMFLTQCVCTCTFVNPCQRKMALALLLLWLIVFSFCVTYWAIYSHMYKMLYSVLLYPLYLRCVWGENTWHLYGWWKWISKDPFSFGFTMRFWETIILKHLNPPLHPRFTCLLIREDQHFLHCCQFVKKGKIEQPSGHLWVFPAGSQFN